MAVARGAREPSVEVSTPLTSADKITLMRLQPGALRSTGASSRQLARPGSERFLDGGTASACPQVAPFRSRPDARQHVR